jgi:hypothetical protein
MCRILAAYRALLWLYPAELRAVYGREMQDVFEQQLAEEGLLIAAWFALRELFTIALPARLLSERMIAPYLSLVITSVILVSLEALLHHCALIFLSGAIKP